MVAVHPQTNSDTVDSIVEDHNLNNVVLSFHPFPLTPDDVTDMGGSNIKANKKDLCWFLLFNE